MHLLDECSLLKDLYPHQVFSFYTNENSKIFGLFVACPKLMASLLIGPQFNGNVCLTPAKASIKFPGKYCYDIAHLAPIYVEFSKDEDASIEFSLRCSWLTKTLLNALTGKLHFIFQSHIDESPLWACFEFLEQEALSYFFPRIDPSDEYECVINLTNLENDLNLPIADTLKLLIDYNDFKLGELKDDSVYECSVCMEAKEGSQFRRLTGCGHSFCCECLQKGFNLQIEKSLNDGHPACLFCGKEVAQREIRNILSKSAYERYETLLLSKALSLMPDVMECPWKDCKASVMLDSPSMGRCPECQLTFCPICRKTYHGSDTCMTIDAAVKAYMGEDRVAQTIALRLFGKQRLARLAAEVASEEYMTNCTQHCPKCKAPIQRLAGCNFMKCLVCRTYFCFLCLTILDELGESSHYSRSCVGRQFERLSFEEKR